MPLPSMYDPEKLNPVNIWYRIDDYSERLKSVEAAEISMEGKMVVSGARFGYTVMLWRTADGALLWEKAHESEVECVTFSSAAKLITTGGEDYFVRIWETTNCCIIRVQLNLPKMTTGIW